MNVGTYHDAAHAKETHRCYGVWWRDWLQWCGWEGLEPVPAAVEDIERYIEYRIGIGDTVGTLAKRWGLIGLRHREGGHDSPISTLRFQRFVQGVKRKLGVAQKQVEGITASRLEALRMSSASDGDLADVAMVALMRDGLLRRGELAALRWGDLTEMPDGSGRMLIRKSKTDQQGRGHTAYVAHATMRLLDEAGLVRGDDGDPVFGFTAQTVCRRIQRAAKRAGLKGRYAGHSPRVGMTQDLAESGMGVPEIMQAGRWTSERMVARYAREQMAARNAVARWHAS